jgi:uncharacterized circularly permuted ATP-grasp superfamily protein
MPREIILSAKSYRKQCIGWNPPRGIWCHITGTDLVRTATADLRAGRQPALSLRSFLRAAEPRGDEEPFPYGLRRPRPRCARSRITRSSCATCWSIWRPDAAQPRVVLLTPGIYNSAYFEHSPSSPSRWASNSWKARPRGLEGGQVLMRTTKGFERVDVIYRRD